VMPVRVVRDDADGLVAWLAPGSPRLVPKLPDGRELRSLPLSELFHAPRVQGRASWRGPGVLLLAPVGTPWSVWLFWTSDGQFSGWYINLEQPHARVGDSTWTCDHELDVWIEPDGTAHLKDSEELDAAVEAGRFTPEEGALIRARADLARAAQAAGHWTFAEEWARWHPDPTWTVPEL